MSLTSASKCVRQIMGRSADTVFCGAALRVAGWLWAWGDGVRCLRGIYRMTVEELAEKAHTTPEEIARIEAGARDVDLATGLRIARALDFDAASLFWEDED